MAYFGKEFKFEKQENFDDFIKILGLSNEEVEKYKNYKPNIKLVKNGDSYTLTLSSHLGTKDTTFKPGVEIEETTVDGRKSKSTFTMDGNTLTQVQNFGNLGTMTIKREFSDNNLVVTISSSAQSSVVARRYYTA